MRKAGINVSVTDNKEGTGVAQRPFSVIENFVWVKLSFGECYFCTFLFRCTTISSTNPGTSVRHTFRFPFCQRLTKRRDNIVVAEMVADMVTDMEVDKVADMMADMAADKKNNWPTVSWTWCPT